MQFGGLKALDNVDLVVKRGSIHGLIGPNGSGKSTMMNVLTGIYVPTAGHGPVLRRIGGRPTSSDIALSGIARTFQNVQLFGEMTALQNVMVGLHHTFRSNLFDVALHTPRYKRENRHATGARHGPAAASSGWPTWRTRRRATCPTASSARSRSRARSRSTRSCCCSTSPPPA